MTGLSEPPMKRDEHKVNSRAIYRADILRAYIASSDAVAEAFKRIGNGAAAQQRNIMFARRATHQHGDVERIEILRGRSCRGHTGCLFRCAFRGGNTHVVTRSLFRVQDKLQTS